MKSSSGFALRLHSSPFRPKAGVSYAGFTGKKNIILHNWSGIGFELIRLVFIGSNRNKSDEVVISIPPGSVVDMACQAVYRQVKAHGFAGPRIEAQGDFRIEKALLITGQEAKSRYNASSIFPDDAQLCYVLVRGNIEVGSPFVNKTTIYETGHAIYDAQTLTIWGIGNGTGD